MSVCEVCLEHHPLVIEVDQHRTLDGAFTGHASCLYPRVADQIRVLEERVRELEGETEALETEVKILGREKDELAPDTGEVGTTSRGRTQVIYRGKLHEIC
jgi:hypothetical protein